MIDARDLAAFVVSAAERGLSGTFNAVDRPTTRAELLATCNRVAGAEAELVWVDGEFLAAQGVGEWLELPLWVHSAELAGLLAVDPARAFAAGLETDPSRTRPRHARVGRKRRGAGHGGGPRACEGGAPAPRLGRALRLTVRPTGVLLFAA